MVFDLLLLIRFKGNTLYGEANNESSKIVSNIFLSNHQWFLQFLDPVRTLMKPSHIRNLKTILGKEQFFLLSSFQVLVALLFAERIDQAIGRGFSRFKASIEVIDGSDISKRIKVLILPHLHR